MAILNKQPIKKTGKARKEQIVAELVEKFDSSNALVFADYQGLTNKQLEELKKELKKLDAGFVVAKNTLLKLALDKSRDFKIAKDNEGLGRPTAALFIKGDMIEPLKKLQIAIKNFGLPKIKFGILEGAVVDEAGVLQIASLPTRDVLLAQFVGTLNFPIRGLATALSATIQKFVMTLDLISKSKPSEPSPQAEPPTESSPAPEPKFETPPASAESNQTEPSVKSPATKKTISATPEETQEKSEAQNSNFETNSNDQNTNE